MADVFGWASFILAACSYLVCAAAIMRQRAEPSVISRFFWLALSVINIVSYIGVGAGNGLFLALANALGCALIFVLALRYGYLHYSVSDAAAVAGALVALVCYVLIDDKLVALSAGLLAHFISGIPTYKKVWRNPYAENLPFWVLFATASVLSLVAGIGGTGAALVYPLYFVLFEGGMCVVLIARRNSRERPATEQR